MSRLKILLVLHKPYPYPNVPELLPIQVNRALAETKLPIQGDDEGDNISEKNANYCELTAMYWAWKNLADVDDIGLFHYRRYLLVEENKIFKTMKYWIKSVLRKKLPPGRVQKSEIRDISRLEARLRRTLKRCSPRKNEIYLAAPQYLSGLTVREHYGKCHSIEQWDILKDVYLSMHPDKSTAFEDIERSRFLSPFNMLIVNKKDFDAYCEWLFAILFEFEKRATVSEEKYQSRVFGFIAERLLNLYFSAVRTDMSIKYLEPAFFDVIA